MKWTHFKESVSGADGKLSFEVANGQRLYVVGVYKHLGIPISLTGHQGALAKHLAGRGLAGYMPLSCSE